MMNTCKDVYQAPEIEVVEMCIEGVIATSSNENMPDIDENDPW